MSLPPIVALEIGTTKVRTLIGEAREDGHIMVTGLGECPARGIRKSEIVDFENALACVRSSLHSAEENGDVFINQVHLLLSGGHIQSVVNRGSVPVQQENGEITVDDIEHCMETGRAVNLASDRELLHTICQHFYVDDQDGVLNPEGMEGVKLSVDMLLLHGVRSRLRNTVKVVRSVPIEIEDVAFSGLCAALAVLTPEHKENGVAVIDLGGGTADYVVYAGNAIATAGSLAVGGDHVTNDIARGLHVPLSLAERLKNQSGSALVNAPARSQRITLPSEGGKPERMVRLSDLNTIIHLRMEEVFTLVRNVFRRDGLLDMLGEGVVLTGGGSRLNGVLVLAEKVFGLPCKQGRPRDVSGLAVATEGPEYASPVGMLRYGIKTAQQYRSGSALGSFLRHLFGRA